MYQFFVLKLQNDFFIVSSKHDYFAENIKELREKNLELIRTGFEGYNSNEMLHL